MTRDHSRPGIDGSLEQYRSIATRYDRMLQIRLGERARRRALTEFDLRTGDTVLDVGCGTGLSFPLIERAIGPTRRIIGIEPSPEMLDEAHRRVVGNGWTNVTLVQSSAEDAQVPEPPDAMVIFRVHEVLRSRPSLQNLFRSVKPAARVLIVGVKWAPWWAAPVNSLTWRLTRSVTTTREGFRCPWDLATEFVPNLHVDSLDLGAQFIARGTTPG